MDVYAFFFWWFIASFVLSIIGIIIMIIGAFLESRKSGPRNHDDDFWDKHGDQWIGP